MADESISKVLADVKEINLPKAATREKRSANWAIPVVTALLLTSGFLAYYFVYVTSQREYLANRNFRSLAVLGDQLQAAVSAHGSILEFYADLAREHKQRGKRDQGHLQQYLFTRKEDIGKENPGLESRRDYLKFLAPNFEVSENPATVESPEHLRPRFEVQRHNGHWQLSLTAERHAAAGKKDPLNTMDFIGSLEFEKLMQPLVLAVPFDDILLVSERGDVIYQQKKAGPQFTTLSSLLQAQSENSTAKAGDKKASGASEPKPATTESVSHNLDETWRSRSMNLTDVTLAGTHYKLFLQPVLVDSFSDDSDQAEPAREWILCGLRSAASLEWEALSISYTAMIWFTVVFFAVAMGGPILKVLFMNRRERFRTQEVASLGIFLILLTAVVTFSALEMTGFPLNDDTEAQLQWLQDRLSGTLHQELIEMRQQLVSWCGSPQFRDDARFVLQEQDRAIVRNSYPLNSYTEAGRPAPPPAIYPYAGNAFWTDDDGRQIIKWSTGRYVTPMIDISGEAIFTHPKDTFLDGKGPTFHFGSVLPPNKLDHLAVLTVNTADCLREAAEKAPAPTTVTAVNLPEDIAGGSSFLSAQPLSLIDPILPAGYGFAIVDETGAVLFHSDKTRNLHENFLEESDWSRYLYSASFGHSGQHSLPIKYKGKSYRARVTAITGVTPAPWSLIVFRDLTWVRTLNLQALTMASTLLLIFLAGPIILIAAWWAVRRPRHAPEWLWPNVGRSHTYTFQIALFTLLALTFLFAGFTGSPERTVLAAAALPYAIVVVIFLAHRAFGPSANRSVGRTKAGIPHAVLALAVAGVLLPSFHLSRGHLHLTGLLSGGALILAVTALETPRRFMIARWIAWQRAASRHPTAGDDVHAIRSARRRYLVSVLLVIFLSGLMLPMALLRASLAVERQLQLKQAQLHLASALDARLLSVIQGCNDGDLSTLACQKLEYARFRSPEQADSVNGIVWNRIIFDPLFPADGRFTVEPHSLQTGEEFYSSWFESVVYFLHHDYNEVAAQALGVISDRTVPSKENQPKEKQGPTPDWSWANDGSHLTLRWHGFHVPKDPQPGVEDDLLIKSDLARPAGFDLIAGGGVAIGVMLIIGVLLWSLARRIFLFHIATLKLPPAQQAAEAIRDGRSVVILTPPASDWRLEGPKWTLDIAELARGQSWAESFDIDTIPPNGVVEIWHFEHTEGDQGIDAQKFVLLERLSSRQNVQLVVVMKVHVSVEDYRRVFPNLDVFDLRDEPFYWLAQYGSRARDLIWKECRDLPALWPLGAQLARDLAHEEVHSKDVIVSEMLERADPYYRIIWKECPADQRFVLAQLAADGMPNPANERAIGQLVRRGLILARPQARVVNESFRRFLCSAPTPGERREWRRESRNSGWGKIHIAFFIALAATGAFLLTTQNALWDSAAAYVTTAMGAFGTVTKLFNTYRGTTSTGSEKPNGS